MRLLVAISHHGLGHLAQAAPVLDALYALRPDIEFLVWSGVASKHLRARIHAPFQHRFDPADVGLVMHDALRVDVAASREAYLEFHRDWAARVQREAEWLGALGCSAVLSDVACLPLAAAAQAGIPGFGLCSLNWVDIASAYLAAQPGMARVLEEMAAAYHSARAFLRVTPAMPMDWLENTEAVPPIAARGIGCGAALRARLGMAPEERLLLIGFGGIAYQAALPVLPRVRWLVPDDWLDERPPAHSDPGDLRTDRSDLVPFSDTGLDFLDLLASCDALVTKVGYGSFVEAAAVGIPVLYLDRPDWPESPVLTRWLVAHTPAAGIDAAALFDPAVAARLAALWTARPMPRVATAGAEHAARRLLECLL